MVHLPHKLEPATDEQRQWLLRRLDLMRALVEQGAPLSVHDTSEYGADGERLTLFHFVCRSRDWEAKWRASLSKYAASPGTS